MRKYIFILLLTILPISEAHAECSTKVCINVYTENGQLVIEGKKNGTTSSPVPRVAATRSPKPRPTASRKYTYKPRVISPKPRNTSKSLADKVLQSLPTLQVAYQPQGKALPKLPVIFWTDLPTFFNKDYKILGQTVSVNLKPKSIWSFGDGSVLVTSKVGKPYPSTEISHSYLVPGTYTVLVTSYWDGSFTVDGVELPIGGAIKQVTAVDVKVVGASTKFVGK
jgi:hypothetical protein